MYVNGLKYALLNDIHVSLQFLFALGIFPHFAFECHSISIVFLRFSYLRFTLVVTRKLVRGIVSSTFYLRFVISTSLKLLIK